MNSSITWFENIYNEDINLVGGKALNLSVMLNSAINVPLGFCITTKVFDRFLNDNSILQNLRVDKGIGREQVFEPETLDLSSELKKDIISAYELLLQKANGERAVAVRSSATVEDSVKSSFAGQFKSYLNIKNERSLIEAVKRCWLSPFAPRVQSYAKRHNIHYQSISVGVIVQAMIEAEASGILFTINPVSGDKSQMIIEAAWGLGEAIVSGALTPDAYILDKKSGEIIQKSISEKSFMLTSDRDAGGTMRVYPHEGKRQKESLTIDQIQHLMQLGSKIETLFASPQDIEWAISKNDGSIYILQSRPVTTN